MLSNPRIDVYSGGARASPRPDRPPCAGVAEALAASGLNPTRRRAARPRREHGLGHVSEHSPGYAVDIGSVNGIRILATRAGLDRRPDDPSPLTLQGTTSRRRSDLADDVRRRDNLAMGDDDDHIDLAAGCSTYELEGC